MLQFWQNVCRIFWCNEKNLIILPCVIWVKLPTVHIYREAWIWLNTKQCSHFGVLLNRHWCSEMIWGPWKKVMKHTRSEMFNVKILVYCRGQVCKIAPNFSTHQLPRGHQALQPYDRGALNLPSQSSPLFTLCWTK